MQMPVRQGAAYSKPLYYQRGDSPQYLPAAHTSKSQTDLLAQIVEVLQNSTIIGERGQDALSKFWAAYKKVSSEYDSDMLERCNGNMDIVLIFAGLFSAVNTAFIITMQPNPVDTTNALLFQMIQISLHGSSAVQQATLSASTNFSSNFWTQALAYASLALSLLAAFGAVMGKQWLGYYKTNCYGHGSLEARCKQRHHKFQTLQSWQFQNVLKSFPLLLQLSLLLFGSSLGAWMWMQQRAISILIIATTGFGLLFHAFTIVVSVISPDSPFQTPVSLAIQTIFRHFRITSTDFHSPDEDSTASAMQWVLETSNDPDIVRSAVELIPTMSKLPDVNIVSLCGEVRDMFNACFDHRGLVMLQDNAIAYGKALIHFSSSNPHVRQMLRDSTPGWNLWKSWRALYLPQALEQCLLSYKRMTATSDANSRRLHQADTRTALRMAVATGIDEFTHPDDEILVWDGRFQLHSSESMEDTRRFIDQLIGCVEYFYNVGDFDVAGDALLLASGIATTSESSSSWELCADICLRIIPFLNKTHQSPTARWCCVALGAARRFLDKHPYLGNHDGPLSQVVLMAVCPPADSTIQNAGNRDEVQFTNAIDLLNFTEWPEGNYLASFSLTEIQQIVLRALPVPNIDNAVNYIRYWRVLKVCLSGADNPLRHSALHVACSAKQTLAQIATTGFDDSQRMVLFNLSPALLAIANDSFIPTFSLGQYLYLIATLARSPDWRHRLITDGHVERCIRMLPDDEPHVADFYLAVFFLRISPPGHEVSCCSCITKEQWWSLMKMAWEYIKSVPTSINQGDDDAMEMIQILVRGTETYMPQDLSKDDVQSLERVNMMTWRMDEIVRSAVTSLVDRLPKQDLKPASPYH